VAAVTSHDDHPAYRAALEYTEAARIGAFERAAACVDPDDLATFQRVLVEAAGTIAAVHGDDDGFVAMLGERDLEAVRALPPATFFARFLAGTVDTDPPLPAARLGVGDLRPDRAEIHYAVAGAPRARLRLRRAGARWLVSLPDDLRAIGDRLTERARGFAAQRADDRATFTDPGDLFPVSIDDRWGFIDRSGRVRIAPRFRRARDFAGGLAPVKVSRRWGYIDGRGALVIAAEYGDAGELAGDVAVVRSGGAGDDDDEPRAGVIDASGRVRLPLAYERVTLVAGGALALTEHDGHWGVVDLATGTALAADASSDVAAMLDATGGALVVDDDGDLLCRGARPVPALLVPALAGSELVRYFDDGRFGYLARDGSVAIPAHFVATRPFADGLAAVCVDEVWGFIDTRGEWVIEPRFFAVDRFAHGIAPVARDGLSWGYVDRAGRQVVPFQFEQAGPATRGLARVQLDMLGAPGYMRPDGSMLWTPEE
jgi:hypothetical protein